MNVAGLWQDYRVCCALQLKQDMTYNDQIVQVIHRVAQLHTHTNILTRFFIRSNYR